MLNKLIWTSIFFVIFLFTSLTLVSAETLESQKISVVGIAKRTVIPDTAYMTFTVSETKSKANTAMESLSYKVNKVVEALKKILPEENITTSNISVYADYTWEDNKRIFNGYKATTTISIKSSVDSAGKVIDLAFNSGVTEMEGIEYRYSKVDDLYLELLKEAMLNAHRQAEILLSSEGARVGKLISVSIQQEPLGIPIFKSLAESSRSNQIPVLSGTEEISVTVNVVYAIEQ